MSGFFKVEKNNSTPKIKVTKNIPSYPEEEKKVHILYDANEAIKILEKILYEQKFFAFDYETTGKKPHAKNHKIVCMSVCYSLHFAYVFPIFYDNEKFLFLVKQLLESKEKKKIAHNIKFEASWTKYIFNIDMKGIYWDTMIASHCLDNNTGVTGLKYQINKRYGIKDYDAGISPYLKAPGKKPSVHDFNNIDKADFKSLLMYCGLDSLFTYRLYEDQKKEMTTDIKKGFDLFMQGTRAFIEIEQNGICIDIPFYKKQDAMLEKKLSILYEQIMQSDEVQQWPEDNFNFNSSTQLSKLLFDILKYKPVKYTNKENNSTDEESLEKLNTDFTKKIVKYKKYYKIKNTYLASFIRDSIGNKIHPSFNLNTVKTFRSSSSDPNFQNIPIRNEKAQKIIRGGICPSFGNQLLEVDYSGIEVRISACYHKDPVMIKYINDPSSDMHRDMAQELTIKNEVTKEERYFAKNNFVFPQFYGDYFGNCAKSLWGNFSKETKEHLKTKGIYKYQQYERHVEQVEYDFWNKRFKVYKQWKEDIFNQYEKTKKISMLTGFRCIDYAKKNEVLNRPIQGSAFHCLLWSLIQLQKFIKENKLQTKIIGQIHDSIIFDLYPLEKQILFPVIRKIMCEDIRKHWDWIIVPLDIEAEITEVDQPWSTKKGVEI